MSCENPGEKEFSHLDIYGRHDEKLKNLESMQHQLSDDICDLKVDLKGDIRELIGAIRESTKQEIEALNHRVVRLENIIFWECFGIITAAATLVWTKVTGT